MASREARRSEPSRYGVRFHEGSLEESVPLNSGNAAFYDAAPRGRRAPYSGSYPPSTDSNLASSPKRRIAGMSTSASMGLSSQGLRSRSNAPQRTTKRTEKLVLFPDQADVPFDSDFIQQQLEYEQNIAAGAMLGDEGPADIVPEIARTEAERMKKETREGFPRVTSYCLAEGFPLDTIVKYVKDKHSVVARKFDECLYILYDSITKSTLFPVKSVKFAAPSPPPTPPPVPQSPSTSGIPSNSSSKSPPPHSFSSASQEIFLDAPEPASSSVMDSGPYPDVTGSLEEVTTEPPLQPQPQAGGEVFIFDYGVIVLWNFSEEEERKYVKEIRRFSQHPLADTDVEIEDLHFQYEHAGPSHPRIFNDMITLSSKFRFHSTDPIIKLTISHGLGQSVKLALFENIMEETIEQSVSLPKRMAQYGEVRLSRIDVMKIVGKLFELRMNVNLVSNVLDTPQMFWTEPEFEPLYSALRVYLEISQRVKILNKRADVLADLVDMLSDHVNNSQLTYVTWIIIVLICGAVIVASVEVWVKSLRATS